MGVFKLHGMLEYTLYIDTILKFVQGKMEWNAHRWNLKRSSASDRTLEEVRPRPADYQHGLTD